MAYPNGFIAVKLRKRLKVPVVITSHKGDIIPQGRYRRRFITRKRMSWALEKADAATGVSLALKNIIDELTLNKAKSSVIPNGVDIPSDSPGEMPQNCVQVADKNFMLTLSRLHHYKGLDILLDAVKLLCEQNIEIPRLVIAGDGKELQNLRSQTAALGLDSKVAFAGSVFGQQKHWLLRNCRFFLQPSRAEGMPLTILEAMAYGKAVIGTKIAGICELVKHGETGFLAEPDNAASLSQAILKILQYAEIHRMQHKAKELASQMSWPVIADRYLELYRGLLK
jgi:glycosyltransferase involved in cell wall biosynthesis